jgi:predicted dehydrogenase
VTRWGILGCGDVVARKTAASFQQASRAASIAAVADKDPARAEEIAQRFSVAIVCRTVEELVEHPDVDAIYIATPPHLHRDHAVLAARAGKHILCEKPMALDAAQCREMMEEAARAGVRLMVAYYRRFWCQTAKIKELIEDGSLGEIVNARVLVTGNVMREPESVRRWKLDPRLSGGGFLMDVGCHRIDLLLHLLGFPCQVAAFAGSYRARHPVDDVSNVSIRFENGALAAASFNWVVDTFTDELEIMGTHGRLLASPLGGGGVVLKVGSEMMELCTPAPLSSHGELLVHCSRVIQSLEAPLVPGEAGLATAAVIDAAYASSRERRCVPPAEFL